MPTGLGDEQLWLSATNDNTGTSTAFNDLSGEGNNGTPNGGMLVVTDTAEGGSYAYDFDGVDDYIDCGNVLNVEYNDAASFSFWINVDSTASSLDGVMGKMLSSGTIRGYLVSYRGASGNRNGISFVLRNDNTSGKKIEVLARNTVSANIWYNFVVTYDGSGLASGVNIYRNGINKTLLLVGDNLSAATTVNSAPYNVGARNSSGVYFDGQLDDLRQYNRVLTQAEITHLATSRGIEGGPGGPPTTGFYNPFINKRFNNDYTRRIR